MGFLEHSAELNETNVELAKDTDVIYKYNFGFGKKTYTSCSVFHQVYKRAPLHQEIPT